MSERYNFQRVRWHSRRGLLELDLFLVPFAEQYFLALSEQDKDRYIKLLGCEDQDLLIWMLEGGVPDDPDIAYMINYILARSRQGAGAN